MALELHDAPVEGDAAVHGGEQTKPNLTADIRGLDCRAIFQQCQQRQHGTVPSTSGSSSTRPVARRILEAAPVVPSAQTNLNSSPAGTTSVTRVPRTDTDL
jgi:hypothetical protein